MFYQTSDHVLRVKELDAFPWLVHGFGTRNSDGWLDGIPVASLQQIHSNRSILLSNSPQDGAGPGAVGRIINFGEGDALVTAQPGLMVSIRTADCVPVLLVDARNRAVAAIHAGWRGVADHVVAAPIEQMRVAFSTSVHDLHAAIGPAIGICCYEVGVEVQQRLSPWWPEFLMHSAQDGARPGAEASQERRKVDLRETIRRQLRQAGLPDDQVYSSHACTRCEAADFHSFRRDRDAAGRMVSAAGIRA
ncbi:MAG: peptidoglycan editing factor PgeF [Acidobacteriia bacterium]|nr:peptidoglycan editing factor PgeF [Terriglobia bacterium]